jgi:hypothetical protein
LVACRSAEALPSGHVLLHAHHQYYGLIRSPRRLPLISFPYRGALLLLPVTGLPRLARPTQTFPSPFLSDHVAANTPEVPAPPSLSVCRADADFVHPIGTRPPLFMIFTKLPVRSLLLRPSRLRSTLTGYIVESLGTMLLCRLLATWLTESCHGRDLRGERPSLPHPTRLGTV